MLDIARKLQHGPTGGSASVSPWAPLAIAALRDLQLLPLLVLAPDVSSSLGVSTGLVGMGLLLQVIVAPSTAFVAARWGGGARGRAVAVVLAATAPLLLIGSAMSPSGGTLVLFMLLYGIVLGAADGVVPVLVAGSAGGRVPGRVGFLWLARLAGGGCSLVLMGILVGGFGLTWRAVLLVASVVATGVVVALALRLLPTMPALDGAGDTSGSDSLEGTSGPDAGAVSSDLGVFELARRVTLIPSARRALSGFGLLGVVASSFMVFTLALLQRRVGLGWGAAGATLGSLLIIGSVVVAVMLVKHAPAGRGELAEDSSEADVTAVELAARWIVYLAPVLLLVPFFGGAKIVALVALPGAVIVALAAAALSQTLDDVIPPAARGVAGALAATFLGPVGTLGGLMLISSFERRFGPGVALAVTGVPALLLGRLVRRLASGAAVDVQRTLASLDEERDLQDKRVKGEHIPMLSCQGVNFSYGQLQVLFDVGFTVDEGEMVALLGTNGAGKSTLLRAISGLGLPDSGRLQFDGQDITYLDAERRIDHGIAQVPGGRAVFGNMTVDENLRVFGHSLGRDQQALQAGIDATYEAFPRLLERRHQLAATMSGGEQQMLALGKAFILKPRLLLIDELSLGLAPIIVGQLLEMVRRINSQGTAIVLVEQSVNVALSLVDHAYFMEKGEIRFDGAAEELLERRDLLRSVFLDGVAQGANA